MLKRILIESKKVLVISSILTLTACAGRFDHLGKEPSMSDVGEIKNPVVQTDYRNLASLPQPEPKEVYKPKPGSLWMADRASFFNDSRAKEIGDILTIVIEIDDKAEIDNETTRERSGSENLGVDNLLGYERNIEMLLPREANLPTAVGLNQDSSSGGKGSVDRSEKIELKVAATVIAKLPNGNLVVKGSQEVRVNYELRDLQIAGIIRPEDVNRQNTISYEKIAEARISYGGRGQINDMQQPRYGQQVLDMILPF